MAGRQDKSILNNFIGKPIKKQSTDEIIKQSDNIIKKFTRKKVT